MVSRTVFVLLSALLPLPLATAQLQWTTLGATGAPMAFGGSAFDPVRNVLVAFGGELGATQSDATREFDPTTAQWILRTPTTRPSARRRPAMVYDEARGECVLFGGGSGPSQFFNDTWTWNGTTWTQRTPATVPPARFGAAMAYDSTRQVVVMFGGFVPSGQDAADLWEWNGVNWTQRTFAGGPIARGAHRMVYDAARRVTVLYGGYRTPFLQTLADTWLWNGTSWTQGPGGPGSLCDQLFVWDAYRQRVVLFGGLRIAGPITDLNATWEWNGATWTQRTVASPPTGRSSMANAFVPGPTARIVCAGGAQGLGVQFANTVALEPTTPATQTEFGFGCPTTGGLLQLAPVSLPYLGVEFVQRITGAPTFPVIGAVLFGFSDTNWNGVPLPLDLTPFGAPFCSALVGDEIVLSGILIDGTGTLGLTLPVLPELVGQLVFTQALVLDPLLPNPLQIGLSGGWRFAIGAP